MKLHLTKSKQRSWQTRMLSALLVHYYFFPTATSQTVHATTNIKGNCADLNITAVLIIPISYGALLMTEVPFMVSYHSGNSLCEFKRTAFGNVQNTATVTSTPLTLSKLQSMQPFYLPCYFSSS